jgi:TfoX/Sxy family transcriptional regulator of competence genes
MAFDEKVRARVAAALAKRKGIVEKRMFGGVAFLHNGNMALGVQDENLMVKVGADNYQAALKLPHARPMDFTGRPLTGYVYVAPAGFKTEKALQRWVESGIVGAAAAKPGRRAKQASKSKKAAAKGSTNPATQARPRPVAKGKVAKKRATKSGAPNGRRTRSTRAKR